MKKKSDDITKAATWRKVFLTVLAIVAVLPLPFVAWDGIWLAQTADISRPVQFQQAKFDSMIIWAFAHKQANTAILSLPSKYKNLSINGKVYFTNDCVFIPSWIGRTTLLPDPRYAIYDATNYGCEGYMYARSNIIYCEPICDTPKVKLNVPEPIANKQIGYRSDRMLTSGNGRDKATWLYVFSGSYDTD